MSYLFNKRSAKSKKKIKLEQLENNGTFKSDSPLLNQQNKRKQTASNSFQDVQKLRRVQLRGWK
ncbi:MAG: hypothetical protein K2X81_22715 [Candidatus Obscuribacterales bacterium]|nr:hypothetical protein [Candidatus Obscuribacterales bacterium]